MEGKPIGPTASAGGSVTDGRKARKYIRILKRKTKGNRMKRYMFPLHDKVI